MLPVFIRKIKSGMKEEEALRDAFGKSEDEMERVWKDWLLKVAEEGFEGL